VKHYYPSSAAPLGVGTTQTAAEEYFTTPGVKYNLAKLMIRLRV